MQQSNKVTRVRLRNLLALLGGALALALLTALSAGGAFAGRLTDTAMGTQGAPSSSSVGADARSKVTLPGKKNDSPNDHAFITLDPGTTDFGCTTPATCPNPPSGSIITTGDRFVLDLMVHAQDHSGSAQQTYVTYTNQLADVADVTSLPTSCILTQAAKPDLTTFESALQNEWCNGPASCVFRGVLTDPGWGAYASGALTNCGPPNGCPGDYRVAEIGWCAMAPGEFTIHWQFSPPAPVTRDTEIVDTNSMVVSNPALFTDYTLTIVGSPLPTITATNTPTPTNTRTVTVTRTPTGGANTPTPTASRTSVAATNTPSVTSTSVPPTNTSSATRTNTAVAATNTPSATGTNTVVPPTGTSSATRTNTVVVPTSTSSATRTNTAVVPTSTSSATGTNTVVPPTSTSSATRTNTVVAATSTASATRTNTSVPPTLTRTAVPPTVTSTGVPPTLTRTAVPPTITATRVPPTLTRTAVPPTRTGTPGAATNTPTRTRTATRTPTNTPTRTPTPEEENCNFNIRHFEPCEDDDGCVEYSIPLRNNGHTGVTLSGSVELLDRHGHVIGTQVIPPTYVPPHETVFVDGQVCPGTDDHDRSHHKLRVRVHSQDPRCDVRERKVDVHDDCDDEGDVLRGQWYYGPVQNLLNAGVISGYADRTFRPNNPVTRGEVAKMVVLAFGLKDDAKTTQHFSDVPASSSIYSYVETVYSRGIMSGYADGKFSPGANVTRGQAAKILVTAAGWAPSTASGSVFKDVPKGSNYDSYIQTARANGLLSGYADGTFRPGNSVTRAQMAKSLYDAMPDQAGEETLPSGN